MNFYESSLTHLVESLVQLPNVPWSQIERVIRLAPRVDVAVHSVTTRQCAAAVSTAVYFNKSGGRHEDKLIPYFVSLLRLLPSVQWNLCKNQVFDEDNNFVASRFASRLISSLLGASTKTKSNNITTELLTVMKHITSCLINIEYLSEKENWILLNIQGPLLLGFIEGISTFLDDDSSPDNTDDLVTVVTECLDLIMKTPELFSRTTDTWVAMSKSFSARHAMETFPYILVSSLLSLHRKLGASDQEFLNTSTKFFEAEHLRLYPKIKQANTVARSCHVNHYSVAMLCECLRSMTASISEQEAYQHYQKLNAVFSATVSTKTPDLHRAELQVCCVEAVCCLTKRYPIFIDDAIEVYKHMLFSPSPILVTLQTASCLEPVTRNADTQSSTEKSSFQRTSYIRRSNRPKAENIYTSSLNTLRDAIIRSLCELLHQIHYTSPPISHGFINSASNQLVTMGSQDSQMMVSSNAVSVLGAIATSLPDSETVKMIIQIFQHRLCNPPSHLDTQMIKQLGGIMLKGNEATFTEVLTLFMQISSRACSESKSYKDTAEHHGYRHCSFTVIRTLETVCAKLESPKLLQEMLPWLLELFVQRSLEIQKLCEREKTSLKEQAGNLGVLLPVFAILMNRIEKVEKVNNRIQRLFRDFWQICVAMNFVRRGLGQYADDWYEGVEAVAIKAPLMSSLGADTFLQHDLQYNSALKLDGTMQESELRSMIGENLQAPELNSIIYRMSYVQCTFFLSAYYIEHIRVKRDTYTCYHLFTYLQDKGIQKDKTGFYQCFEYMCTQIFSLHLRSLASKPRDAQRQRLLENLAQFLLVKFNNCMKKIRLIADKWLSQLIEAFNHLLWSESVLECMESLTQLLLDATRASTETGVQREVPVPYEPGTMSIAEEAQDRTVMLKDFSKRFAGILRESLKFAPVEKVEMLREYEERLKALVKEHDIALEELGPIDRGTGSNSTLKNYSAATISKANRNKYYGHIEGMKSLVNFQGGQFNFSEMVLLKMESELKDFKADDPGSRSRLEEAINHTSAYLISEPNLDRKLLRALCWAPVKCFHKEALTVITSCWEWVVSQRPEFDTYLLLEIIAAWKSTVYHKIGLFEPSKPHKRPVVTDNKQEELAASAPNSEPHRIWIEFLIRRFEVIKWQSSKQVELFTSLFHSTLPLTAQNSVISTHITAIGARFHFLHLGLLLLQNDIISNELNQSILRERIYTAILDYFCSSAEWPCYTTAQVSADVEVLSSFWDTLFHDKKYLKSILVPTAISPDSIQLPSALYNNTLLGSTLFVDGGNSPSIRTRSLSVERTKAGSVALTKKNSKAVDYKSKYHLKKRNLILYLLHHEIERLYIWANPMADSLPNDEKKINFVYKNFSEKTWNEYMQLAWTCHPMLTLGLALRVRNSDVISRCFQRFVKSAPANFYTCTEAIQFLATPLNVKHDNPQLIHMLEWAPSSPLETLSYFSKDFDENAITGMYALQSIQSYPCETLLFLVPQIVQATRHDTHGFVKQIIQWISNLSPIVTHSIVWNMKTNMYLDEDGTQIDPDIGENLEEYINDITSNMPSKYLEFYNREFDFFNSVTEVSSIIKPYPKGPERNKKCLEALGKIKVQQKGTYLPSNPDAVIIGIDYNSGKPMQSAAKAPFLATFKVKDCEVTEMQSFEMTKADLTRGVSWKSCIFKEGDDLRQDILALQIIHFFQATFKTVGLDVYLKPYKVVATAPGSGVIEVVPNTKTRDELGKKTAENLYDHFIQTYGDANSIDFQNARENFIKSMAGYSVVTWLLQIKDRHNGNIMIDNEGHIIHIDFGFLFESSPGGNMGFEPDIKLTEEMIQIMGGTVDSPPFKRFTELCIRAFLAVRPYCEAICTLVSLMMETNLPCFIDDALRKLRQRFQPTLSDKDAANWAREMIRKNTLNMRSEIYDYIQWHQNQITY